MKTSAAIPRQPLAEKWWRPVLAWVLRAVCSAVLGTVGIFVVYLGVCLAVVYWQWAISVGIGMVVLSVVVWDQARHKAVCGICDRPKPGEPELEICRAFARTRQGGRDTIEFLGWHDDE